jgi:hypothetical protein
MKKIIVSFLICPLIISCKQNPEKEMNELQTFIEKQNATDVVNSIFINTDERNWGEVEACFADTVKLDYTSMVGGEPALLIPQQIIESWKGILPGFESTHHQIGNCAVKIINNKADLSCYGTASHYLPVEVGDPLWIVDGTYDFHLINKKDEWKVDKMKFYFKYQTGNTNLPAAAQEKLK